MAKKKQLAGKKTKLAKLPLTRVLTSQTEEPVSLSPPPAPPALGPRPRPLAWDQVSQGVAGPLAAAYFHLIQELTALRFQLQPATAPPLDAPHTLLPPHLPDPYQLQRALKQAQSDLWHLYRLLSE